MALRSERVSRRVGKLDRLYLKCPFYGSRKMAVKGGEPQTHPTADAHSGYRSPLSQAQLESSGARSPDLPVPAAAASRSSGPTTSGVPIILTFQCVAAFSTWRAPQPFDERVVDASPEWMGLTAASLVSPPHHLRTDEIVSKRWGPPLSGVPRFGGHHSSKLAHSRCPAKLKTPTIIGTRPGFAEAFSGGLLFRARRDGAVQVSPSRSSTAKCQASFPQRR